MIQIAAYRGRSLISRLIRWQTGSDYSHIAIRFTGRFNMSDGESAIQITPGDVIEAWVGGVRLNPSLSTLHTDRTRVDVFELKTPLGRSQAETIVDFLLRQLGKGYAYRSVLRFLTREPRDVERNRWFCSELTFAAFEHAGIQLLERTPAWRVPPDWIPRSPLLQFKFTTFTHR